MIKEQEHKRAVILRKRYGWSLRKIASHLKISTGTASLWVRSIKLSEGQRKALCQRLDVDYHKAKDLLARGLSHQEIANNLGLTKLQTYCWLFNHGLTKKCQQYQVCQICGKKNLRAKVKHCSTCDTSLRRYRHKIRAVKLLGGKCLRCGIELPVAEYGAYEFHHRDHEAKDWGVGQLLQCSWKRLEKEILKCDLLCSNCHNVVHTQMNNKNAILIEAARLEGVKLV